MQYKNGTKLGVTPLHPAWLNFPWVSHRALRTGAIPIYSLGTLFSKWNNVKRVHITHQRCKKKDMYRPFHFVNATPQAPHRPTVTLLHECNDKVSRGSETSENHVHRRCNSSPVYFCIACKAVRVWNVILCIKFYLICSVSKE